MGEPYFERFLRRLATFSRLIRSTRRGTGPLSDPVALSALPTLERWMDDVRAVTDAVRSTRAALLGSGGGGVMSMLFAATYPEQTAALVLINSFARLTRTAGYPMGTSPEFEERIIRELRYALGPRRAARDRLPEPRRRSRVPRMVGALPAARLESGNRDRDAAGARGAGRARRPARDRRADADPQPPREPPGRCGAQPATWPNTSRARGTWSSTARTTSPSSGTAKRSSTASRSWSRAHGRAARTTASSRPCCSPTSWDRPSARPPWATTRGAELLDRHNDVVRRELGRLPRPRGRRRRGRLPRALRRSRASDRLRLGDRRRAEAAGRPDPRGLAHRRGRRGRPRGIGGIAIHIGARVAALARPARCS